MLEVSEVFANIQGEGRLRFQPSVFVRLRRCNLQCSWCDTKYTWSKDDPGYNVFATRDTSQLAADIRVAAVIGVSSHHVRRIGQLWNDAAARIAAGPVNNLVFTGGEPLIWRGEIQKLLEVLPEFLTIEVETNGIVPPFPQPVNEAWNISYNVSPKLQHSGNEALRTWDTGVIRRFADTGRAYFKFVIRGSEDYDELKGRIRELQAMGVNGAHVYLMPLGATLEEVSANEPEVRELAFALAVQYTPRLHVVAWGAERGV
jgi:organic radical activating enzyme